MVGDNYSIWDSSISPSPCICICSFPYKYVGVCMTVCFVGIYAIINTY